MRGGRLGPRVFRAGIWAFARRILAATAGFARTVVLARILSPHDFGTMAIALVLVGGVEALTSTGFQTALIQRRDDVDAFFDTAFTVQAIRGVVLAAAFWLAAPAGAAFFAAPDAVPVIRAVGVAILLRGLANPGTVHLFRDLRFETLFWWSVPEVAVSFGVAVALGLLYRNVWALAVSLVAAQAVASVVSHLMVRHRPRFALDRGRLREVLGYSRWVSGANVMMFLGDQADNAFTGKVFGAVSLGLYEVAYRLAFIPVVAVTQVAGQIALPVFSEISGDRARLERWYSSALRVVLLAQGAFTLLLLAAAGPFTRLVIGVRWMPIVPALRILAVAMLLRSIVALTATLFNAVGEPRLAYYVNALQVAVMLAVIYPLTRVFHGIEGVALAVLVGMLAAAIGCGWMLERRLGIRWLRAAQAAGRAG